MTQTEIDKTWTEIAASQRARMGLSPMRATDDGSIASPPDAGRVERRDNAPRSQVEIDALWADIARKLNATLPPDAYIPANAPRRR